MPRTTYSDFSLPNFQQDFDYEKRTLSKRKNLIHKKKSRNIAKPTRKKRRNKTNKLVKYQRPQGALSPQHKIQSYDEDSASFQSDFIDNRLEDEDPTVDRAEDMLPFLDKDCEKAVNKLVEQC